MSCLTAMLIVINKYFKLINKTNWYLNFEAKEYSSKYIT